MASFTRRFSIYFFVAWQWKWSIGSSVLTSFQKGFTFLTLFTHFFSSTLVNIGLSQILGTFTLSFVDKKIKVQFFTWVSIYSNFTSSPVNIKLKSFLFSENSLHLPLILVWSGIFRYFLLCVLLFLFCASFRKHLFSVIKIPKSWRAKASLLPFFLMTEWLIVLRPK